MRERKREGGKERKKEERLRIEKVKKKVEELLGPELSMALIFFPRSLSLGRLLLKCRNFMDVGTGDGKCIIIHNNRCT